MGAKRDAKDMRGSIDRVTKWLMHAMEDAQAAGDYRTVADLSLAVELLQAHRAVLGGAKPIPARPRPQAQHERRARPWQWLWGWWA